MSTTFAQIFSARAGGDGLEVTASFQFHGDGVTFAVVEAAFTTEIKRIANQLGTQAAESMAKAHNDDDAAMRAALSEALDKVSPEQRAVLVERYDLATEGV